ncbi:MAG: PAS domain-containing protein, partial [Cyclobacteriaceae bacterium]|nr:PAS domain-containing protein [Cyclobacteriaceae bacterium]
MGTGIVRKMVTKSAALGRQLDQKEKDYRMVFEGISEGVFKTTMEGKILLANPSLARIFGYRSPTEMIGMVADIGDQLYYS